MASKLIIRLEWENNNFFEMGGKFNDDGFITIIRVEENGCIELLWSNISAVCKSYLAKQLDHIGDEMKQ